MQKRDIHLRALRALIVHAILLAPSSGGVLGERGCTMEYTCITCNQPLGEAKHTIFIPRVGEVCESCASVAKLAAHDYNNVDMLGLPTFPGQPFRIGGKGVY